MFVGSADELIESSVRRTEITPFALTSNIEDKVFSDKFVFFEAASSKLSL